MFRDKLLFGLCILFLWTSLLDYLKQKILFMDVVICGMLCNVGVICGIVCNVGVICGIVCIVG